MPLKTLAHKTKHKVKRKQFSDIWSM